MIICQRHNDDNHDVLECFIIICSLFSFYVSVLRDSDGRFSAVPAAVTAGCRRGGTVLHPLQLEPPVCRGGGASDLHFAGP